MMAMVCLVRASGHSEMCYGRCRFESCLWKSEKFSTYSFPHCQATSQFFGSTKFL